MSKTFEERQVKKIQMRDTKALGKNSPQKNPFYPLNYFAAFIWPHAMIYLEHELKENTKVKKEEKKAKIIEKRKLKMENEYKNTTYQVINPEKMKRMNKKQLRMIKKTSVNRDGTVEFVSPYAKIQDNSAHARKVVDASNIGGKTKGRR